MNEIFWLIHCHHAIVCNRIHRLHIIFFYAQDFTIDLKSTFFCMQKNFEWILSNFLHAETFKGDLLFFWFFWFFAFASRHFQETSQSVSETSFFDGLHKLKSIDIWSNLSKVLVLDAKLVKLVKRILRKNM